MMKMLKMKRIYPILLVIVIVIAGIVFIPKFIGNNNSSMRPVNEIIDEIDSLGGLPTDVETAVCEFYNAALIGPEEEAEVLYWPEKYQYMQQIHASDNGTTVNYKIKKIEQVNDNLYQLTVDLATSQDYVTETVTHCVGKIDGTWRYMIHPIYVPDDISDGLEYTLKEDEILPDDIIGPIKIE